METLSPDLAQRLTAAVDGMPAFPKSAQKIIDLTRDVSCSPKDLVQVIDKDPVVTVKVLRVVNSAYYGLSNPITSVDHAVVFLGFNTIKNVALSIAAVGMLPSNTLARFDSQRYLMHSLTTAGIARQLAQQLPQADSHDCFIAGLLHDFGKVVVAQFMPQEFQRSLELSVSKQVPFHVAVHEVIGVDHSTVGAMLVQKWRFADDLVETIKYQHQPERSDTDMMACVCAANLISKQLGFDFGGYLAAEQLPPSVNQRLGGTLEQVNTALGDVNLLVEEAQMYTKL